MEALRVLDALWFLPSGLPTVA